MGYNTDSVDKDISAVSIRSTTDHITATATAHYTPDPSFKTPEQSAAVACPTKNPVIQRNSLQEALDNSKDMSFITVSGKQMAAFLDLIELPVISKFLVYDRCLRVSDKYLLAMAFAYFARSNLPITEYNPLNFFTALYLAHDMEEDEEDYKYELFPWALGRLWRQRHRTLLNKRDELWKKIGYRGVVSRRCCEEIMSIEPDHTIWKRERKEHHSGAIRPWNRDKFDDLKIVGPDNTPKKCSLCGFGVFSSITHDSLSPENDHFLFNMDTTESTEPEIFTPANLTNGSTAVGSGNVVGVSTSEGQLTRSGTFVSVDSSLTKDEMSLNWVDCPTDSYLNHEP